MHAVMYFVASLAPAVEAIREMLDSRETLEDRPMSCEIFTCDHSNYVTSLRVK